MINANSATRRAHTHEQRRLGLMAILILTERRIYSYLRYTLKPNPKKAILWGVKNLGSRKLGSL
jgi:hypothetical protein